MSPVLLLALTGCAVVNTFLLACMVFLYQDSEHPTVMPSLWPWLLWGWIGFVSVPVIATVLFVWFA